eukprot:4479435-Lingulodinium_polyedra.AAC.1
MMQSRRRSADAAACNSHKRAPRADKHLACARRARLNEFRTAVATQCYMMSGVVKLTLLPRSS